MKNRNTLSAKNFTLSSYAEDIFNGFGPLQKPESSGVIPSLPPSARNRSATIKTPKHTIQKETEAVSDLAKHTRTLVPHDFTDNDHDDLLKSATMISYHPRNKGLYGITNRMSYLRALFNDNEFNIGARGSKSLALGLTEAGCPSSKSRTLEAPSTFGQLQKRSEDVSDNVKAQDFKIIIEPKLPAIVNNGVATSFFDVLTSPVVNRHRTITSPIVIGNSARLAVLPPTRYSANKEWSRATHILVQPVENCASYSSEMERLSRAAYVDEQGKREAAKNIITIK